MLVLIAAACGRRTIRDHLTNPVQIVSADADQLVLADGSKRTVPHVSELIAAFPSINAVEVKPDGTLWCLIGLDHWCGNDPIGTHVEKVPLTALIEGMWTEYEGQAMARDTSRKKLNVSLFYDVVAAGKGTWDRDAGATFPGE